MLRGAILIFLLAAGFFVAALLVRRGTSDSPGRRPPEPSVPAVAATPPPLGTMSDDFQAPVLDSSRWFQCSEGDFKEKVVDIQDGRLRLRCATIGTDNKTVKYLGVRSASPLRLGRETRVSTELDWNHQFNGCYLSGALVISPVASSGNPLSGPDWLRIEYVGVPPGKNGRLVVASRSAGRERYLFMEGWPEQNREGRPLSVQKIELILKGGGFELLENGRRVYECTDKVVLFQTAHLYLQMSSYSNYPPRQLYFDNVRWSALE